MSKLTTSSVSTHSRGFTTTPQNISHEDIFENGNNLIIPGVTTQNQNKVESKEFVINPTGAKHSHTDISGK